MVFASFNLESQLWSKGFNFVCGVDEVGRGCFAGPVVAGAIIFPKNCQLIKGLADSKLLSAKKREELEPRIKDQAISWSVGIVEVDIINEVGIGKASQLSYIQAIEGLNVVPDYVLMDAFRIKEYSGEQRGVVRGDKVSGSIAAAAIIAKVFRDKLMESMDGQLPGYGFAKHKGYGTREHQQAIKRNGLSRIHRRSFNLEKFVR